MNNFLFKYENGKPVDVLFVDYQMSYYSSPGLDLNYFINTSPHNDVRENHIDELLHTYYGSFASALDALAVKKIPTIDDVRREIKRCEYYGLMAAFGILPIVVLDAASSESSNVESLIDEQESEKQRCAMYTNDIYQKAVKPILRRYDEDHLLDELAALAI